MIDDGAVEWPSRRLHRHASNFLAVNVPCVMASAIEATISPYTTSRTDV